MRAITSRDFDLLNRLRVVSTAPAGGGSGWASHYAYNSANQRTRRTDIDGSFWVYQYDALGQVIAGKRFWADGTPVAGQQYEYAYDDIGNRTASKDGGDDSGLGLRSSAYTGNSLNQYTGRANAPFVDVVGLARAGAAVTVNGVGASRRGEYFRRELGVTNAAGPAATPRLYDGWPCLAELNAGNSAYVAGYAWGLEQGGRHRFRSLLSDGRGRIAISSWRRCRRWTGVPGMRWSTPRTSRGTDGHALDSGTWLC